MDISATTIELVSCQTQEDLFEKDQNKHPTKSLERNQSLEILLPTELFVWLNLSYANLFLG